MNDLQKSLEKMKKVLEELEQEKRDKRIADKFKEDADRRDSVQWTNWDFRG